MKYQCEIIRDLLPLYQDGVCSEKSREAVEEHLAECAECVEYRRKMSDVLPELTFPERELHKAESFKSVRRRIKTGKIIAAAVSVVVVIGILISALLIMFSTTRPVAYENGNITVSMQDEGLIGRVRGTACFGYHVKNFFDTDENDDQARHISFICLYETVGGAIFTDKDSYSEFTVAYSDKGADKVDAVYYYTGDFGELNDITPETLTAFTEKSVLLWERQQ